ncbi:MAG: hypothetical protein JOY66_18915 [Acetobacteraceae bacterium]|nr:hypothetical protein [Acetobacteraceae bacterium]
MRRRLAISAIGLTLAGGSAALAVHLHRTVVPPDCRDPRTLAQLATRLPAGERVARIRVIAGGPLAFRFVCEADLEGARALTARYTSQLVGPGARHEVAVAVSPVLVFVQVQ